MVFNPSSPLPFRRPSFIPHSPSLPKFSDFDEDELASDDQIPCSPSPYFTQSTQITRRTTQPTQVLNRGTQPTEITNRQANFRNPISSSPTADIVEVPASSPFQQQPKRPVGGALAPRGTYFRPPPPRPQISNSTMKRPAAEPIVISDDEDGLSPTRGDIRPTNFKKVVESFRHVCNGIDDEVVKEIQAFMGPGHSPQRIKMVLQANHNNKHDTINYLLDAAAKGNYSPTKSSKAQRSSLNNARSSPDISSSPVQAKPRRRLMRGLRPRSPEPSSPAADPAPESSSPQPSSPPEVVVINDDSDAYEEPQSASQVEGIDQSTLRCINDSTIEELAAMTGIRVDDLKVLAKRRPFASLDNVRDVSAQRKPGSRKAPRHSLGDGVVSAIQKFTTAVAAVDEIVGECEAKAKVLKEEMNSWDMDLAGMKRSKLMPQQDDGTLTPTSFTKLIEPPISRQPKMMDGHCEMRDFQIYGLNWMSLLYRNGFGCILADEMGLGKTCQVISLICHLVESYDAESDEAQPWPNLIVVPPSTYSNWLAEIKRFAPGLSVIGYQGSQKERREIAEELAENADDYHIVLSTYSQLKSDEDTYVMIELEPVAAIFDEGHKMKNPETQVYQQLINIPAQWRMLLTGTPVQNNLMEMVGILNFIDPQMFEGHMEQIEKIFSHKVTLRDVGNGAFLYQGRVGRARTILEPFILQRRKQQVLKDIPAKTCNVVYCELSKTQKPAYERYESLFKSGNRSRAPKPGRGNDENNVWIQLRKAALHPHLFRRHFDDAKVEKMAKIMFENVPQSELQQPHLHHLVAELKSYNDFELHLWCRDTPCIEEFDVPEGSWMDSGKVQTLIELCKKFRDNGDRVLVFSKFVKVIEILREILHLEGIDHCVLCGATDVKERQPMIDEFNNDPEKSVFLLTTAAGGTGINLTSANKVIIFDQSDNPQDDIQAENRAHRFGQKREVEVIRLISKGTIEELVYKACQKKVELANKVTGQDEGEDAEANMEAEIRKMMELTP
jgi:SWI/SNF-related matrix-associated actin-dependent regulator of chromatin subfamily A containing DEAD/H box 1